MPGWSFKRDADGRPRRFLNHGEAALWSSVVGGVGAGGFLVYIVVLPYLLAAVGVVDRSPVSLFDLVVPVMIWTVISVPLYLYVALGGGVMDREARRRYLEEETGQPRTRRHRSSGLTP